MKINLGKHDERELNPAQSAIVAEIMKWPILYPDRSSFMLQCVWGTLGDWSWTKDGLLVSKEINPRTGKPYPDCLDVDNAYSFYLRGFFETCTHFSEFVQNNRAPVHKIPDNIDPSWVEEIENHIFHWEMITEEQFETILTATRLMKGYSTNFFNGCRDAFIKFKTQNESIKARLRVIEETKKSGKIPPYTYQGMFI
jgi:hypothetical protein